MPLLMHGKSNRLQIIQIKMKKTNERKEHTISLKGFLKCYSASVIMRVRAARSIFMLGVWGISGRRTYTSGSI